MGFQFPIAALAFVAITECVLRPAGNLTAASSDFIQQYSAIVARGRCSVYRKKDSLHYSERASKRARKSRRMRRNNGEDVKHELEAHHSPSARRMGMTAQRLNFPPESQVEQTAATCGKHGDCHGRPLPSGERTKTRRPGNQRDEDAIQVVHQVRPTLRYRRNPSPSGSCCDSSLTLPNVRQLLRIFRHGQIHHCGILQDRLGPDDFCPFDDVRVS